MFGIVAGLGPKATIEFYSALMNAVTRDSEGCLPRLILYSVAMSPSIENSFLEGAVDANAPQRLQVRSLLNEAVQHFVNNDVSTVVMACNTLQDELTALCKANNLLTINMIDETTNAIVQANAKRVLILGTASTYCDDLYGKRLNTHNIDCVYPSAAQQSFIETYIRNALNQNIAKAEKQQFVESIKKIAHETKADSVVLACTDLTMDLNQEAHDLMVFDSLKLLVKASAKHILARSKLFC